MKGRKKVLKVERDLDDETEQLFEATFSLMREVNLIDEKLKKLEKSLIRIKLYLIIMIILFIILIKIV